MSESLSSGENYKVRDLGLAEKGRMKIDWAESRMPVIMELRREHAEKQSLQGMRVAGCLLAGTGLALVIAFTDVGARAPSFVVLGPLLLLAMAVFQMLRAALRSTERLGYEAALLSGERPTIYGDGQQSRDFTFVKNVVHGNLLAAEAKGVAGKTLNVANGRATSLLTLIRLLNELLGTRKPAR